MVGEHAILSLDSSITSVFQSYRVCERMVKFGVVFGGEWFSKQDPNFTEARSEGLIELKLVRKPPKVSRGCGGVARAAAAASVTGSPNFLVALYHNRYFGVSPYGPRSGLVQDSQRCPIRSPRGSF